MPRPAAAPRSRPGRRPTLADVARRAGVSLMTASYALRNNPKISAATRRRVARAARQVHYVPHPEISRLMYLLRSTRLPAFQATLGFLSFSHDPKAIAHPYTRAVIAGASARARQFGYSIDFLNIDSDQLSPARLTTMLKSRGIRGVLIPPLPAIEDCSRLLDWSQFAVVAATYSAQNLIVNRVVPHHQANILLAIAKLRAAGCRRPGLVLTSDFAFRANFAYQAALALYQQAGDFEAVPALSLDASQTSGARLAIRRWLVQHRPDTLLTVESAVPVLRELLGPRFGAQVGVCLLDHGGAAPYPGVDQHPAIIGQTAMELLAGQVQRGEIGSQSHPRVTMVYGGWLEAASGRARPASLH